MAGTRTGLELQPRDRRLLTALNLMRVVDREQAKVVAGFHSTTRANARLLQLVRAKLLARVPVGTVRGGHKFLYSLSPLAARVQGVPYRGVLRVHTVLAGNLFLEHQLRLNELYLQLAYGPLPDPVIRLRTWQVFQQPLSASTPLMPDAYVELDTRRGCLAMFIEVDLGTESLGRWKQKAQRYLQLAVSGEFTRLFRQPQFRVLVLLHSERRVETVRRVVSRQTTKLFWFATFEAVQGERLWSACWLRSQGSELYALM